LGQDAVLQAPDYAGHSSVTTTQRYTHMDAEDLRQQVAEMPGNHSRRDNLIVEARLAYPRQPQR